MGKYKVIIFILGLLFVINSCQDDENLTSPNLKSKSKAEIILPYYEEGKAYPEHSNFYFRCVLNLNGQDSVEVDSVVWMSDIDGDIRNRYYNITAGTHNITCFVYKDEMIFDTTFVLKISDEIKLNTKDLGQGWTEYTFTDELITEKSFYDYHQYWALDFDEKNNLYLTRDHVGLIYKEGEKWRYYSTADGLTNLAFQFIIRNGMIYSGDGGYSGLYVLGGDKKWRFFDYKDLVSVSGPDIHSLVFDDNNKLWIGTHNGDILTFYDRKFEKIEQPKQFIRLDELIYKNDKLYGVGSNTELFEYDGVNWTLYELPDYRFSSLCIEVDNDTIWTGGRNSLYKIVNGEISEHPDSDRYFNLNTVYEILKDSKGQLWIASFSGIYKYYNSVWTFYDRELFSENDDFVVHKMKEDKNGDIWLVCGDRIVSFNNK